MPQLSSPESVQLSDAERDALSKELSAHLRATQPEAHHCFCGGDAELIEAVTRLRAERERELGRDDDEIGG